MANQQTIPTEVIVFVLGLGCSLIPWLWEKGGGVMSRLTALLFLTVAVAMVWWSLTRLGWPELVPLGKRTTTYSGAALTGIALVVVGRLWIPFMFPPKEDVVPRPTRTRLQFNAIDTYPTVIDMSESG